MASVADTCPLIALDAVIIDTETTGLDPATARIVEIATVRLAVGRLSEQSVVRRLVQPDVAIPAEATKVHGIDHAKVESAARFAAVWPEFASHVADSVLIGYAIGFDIAVLQRECARAGMAWHSGAALDVALLARLVEPNLASHSLDSLAAWLGVEAVGRHSAAGDAVTAARIFLALVPELRERGIRTLAEALRASGTLATVLEGQYRAGWAEPTAVQPAEAPSRIDTYPYRHRAGAIMSPTLKTVGPDTSVGAALDIMARERISSVLVFPPDAQPRPEQVGIVTERDVLRMLSQRGAAALAVPVRQAMSAPLASVPADAFAYLAIGRMNRLKIRHLGVTGANGEVAGILTARDLLRLRAGAGIEIGDQIEQANDVRELGLAWSRLPTVARDLRNEGMIGREVAAVISHQLCELTRHAAVLAERAMKDGGFGEPPFRYVFVVLGSAGRGESLLAMDQDNALIYECGGDTPDHDLMNADRWFASLGAHVADILHQVGVPYCPGGVMARNPQWRGSLATWRARVAEWIGRASPQDLLTVDIFFDLLGVHGEITLADRLWRDSLQATKGEASFAKLLTEASGARQEALGWFSGFRTDAGRIDLKKSGLFPIVSAARALAIGHGIAERATPMRLAAIKALNLGQEADLDAFDSAHALFLDLVLAQQIEDIAQGRPPGNTVEVKRLTRRNREQLRVALRAIAPVDVVVRDLLF